MITIDSVEKLNRVMSHLWDVPYTNGKHQFGLSALFMLLPGGSTVSFCVKSQYVILAWKKKAGYWVKVRIIYRLFLDWLLGLPPVLGSILTHFYKADEKIIQDLRMITRASQRQNKQGN